MIRVIPYYDRPGAEQFQKEYLRMIAAATPFLTEEILYDDPEGLKLCNKTPKMRTRKKNGKDVDTEFKRMLVDYGVSDRHGTAGQLQTEAELAEVIIQRYSDDLHTELYGKDFSNGHVIRENLRKLLLIKLPKGYVPEEYRYNSKRSGTKAEWKKHSKALYDYVFRYDEFSKLKPSKGHLGIHELVLKLNVKVCPYCNRMFTTTVNLQGHMVRPQLDHFRNKSDYPFLALSINNLVPACGVCNLLKLDQDKDFVYPYEEDFDAENLIFKTNIPLAHIASALEGISISEQDFQIKIERKNPNEPINDNERGKRIEKSIQELSLAELYQSHRDYVAFLYRQRYILTNKLAEDIHNQFPTLYSSVEEVKDVFALMKTDYEHRGDRPLSKLTHDIVAEIDELYEKENAKGLSESVVVIERNPGSDSGNC